MDLNPSPAAGTRDARVSPARYAIGGVEPREAVRPGSVEEVAEVLARAHRDRLGVVPWGGGTSLATDTSPDRYDLALDVQGLDRVLEYDPEDVTLTAQCGVVLATLAATVAARGQELPLEAAHSARATLGGVLAANAGGARRLRFGAPRDRLLGARFVLADGTVARSGGRVVKNVAGHAVHRLLCGSRGALAVMVEASLKLAPAPAARVALVHRLPRDEFAGFSLDSALARLEPSFATVIAGPSRATDPSGWTADTSESRHTVVVGLEDDPAWVTRQEAAIRELLGAPIARLEGEHVVAAARTLADLEAQSGPRLTFTTARRSLSATAAFHDDPGATSFVYHVPAGRLHVFPGTADPRPLVARLRDQGFQIIDTEGTQAVVPRAAPAIMDLRRRIRAGLDPGGNWSLGERWG